MISRDTQRPVTLSRLLGVAVITGEKTGNHQEKQQTLGPGKEIRRVPWMHQIIKLLYAYRPASRLTPLLSHLLVPPRLNRPADLQPSSPSSVPTPFYSALSSRPASSPATPPTLSGSRFDSSRRPHPSGSIWLQQSLAWREGQD